MIWCSTVGIINQSRDHHLSNLQPSLKAFWRHWIFMLRYNVQNYMNYMYVHKSSSLLVYQEVISSSPPVQQQDNNARVITNSISTNKRSTVGNLYANQNWQHLKIALCNFSTNKFNNLSLCVLILYAFIISIWFWINYEATLFTISQVTKYILHNMY